MVFYTPFLQGHLFNIGSAKVYPGDLVMASLLTFLFLRALHKGFPLIPRSTKLFSLLFVWGIVAIASGIPRYSYSAVGEARWYVLPMLYYFSVLVIFTDKRQVQLLVKWFLRFLSIMIVFHFVDFYLMGGKERIPAVYWNDYRTLFRFVNATEAWLLAFVLVSLLLFYIVGEARKRKVFLYLVFGALLAIIVITQHRSVWLATAIGLGLTARLVAVRFIFKGLPVQSILLINAALLSLVFFSFIAGSLGGNIYEHIAKSASFFQDPLDDPTGSWRLKAWQSELETAMKRPIFGQGLGGYSEWFDGQQWQRVAVHNGYIMHLSKFGIVGLLLLFTSLVRWYAETSKYVRIEKNSYYKLLGYAIQISVFMHLIYAFFYDFTIFFWILLAIGTVLARGYLIDRSVSLDTSTQPKVEWVRADQLL